MKCSRIKRALFAATVLALWKPWSHAGTPAGDPLSPPTLLEMAISPEKSYSGRIGLTQWRGKQAHSEDVQIYFSPTHGYRREYLTPTGTVDRILLANGDEERLHLIQQRLVLTGNPITLDSRLAHKRMALELLFKNYSVEKKADDRVLGRTAWALDITPKEAGKPHQRYWIDQETKVILESERFLPEGGLASRARFTRFEAAPNLPSTLFDLAISTRVTVVQHELDPDYLSLADLHAKTGMATHYPDRLPGGFQFDSADTFELEKTTVLCARYTDGLTAVSLFQTARPVKPGTRASSPETRDSLLDSMGTAQANHVYQWRTGDRYFTLVGDVSTDLMRRIAGAFR